MKTLIIITLAAVTAGAPITASARDIHHAPRHVQKYPKGWGPHRGADRHGYYHGYRGYHDHRPGYRRGHDGLWYPAAAFAIGAIIGGALSR